MLDRKRDYLDKTKPQAAKPAVEEPDIFEAEQHRGVFFVLDQLCAFYATCELLELPCTNPFAFWDALCQKLENWSEFRFNGSPDSMKDRFLHFMALFLLYASYGDSLFCFSNKIPNAHLTNYTEHIRLNSSLSNLKEELYQLGLDDVLRDMTRSSARRKIYTLYPLLLQQNEWNRKSVIMRALGCVTYINTEPPIMPDAFASDLYHLFLSYYAKHQGYACELSVRAKLPTKYAACEQYLQSVLALRQLEKEILLQKMDTVEQIAMGAKRLKNFLMQHKILLKQPTTKLSPRLQELPKLDEFNQQLETDLNNISERLEKLKAQDAALVGLTNGNGKYEPKKLKKLANRLRELLHSYEDSVVFCFLNAIYREQNTYPIWQKLAPAYVWRLFSRHRKPFCDAKKYLLKGKKSPDLSAAGFFNDVQYKMQSEQRTSESHANFDCELFDALNQYFGKKLIEKFPSAGMKNVLTEPVYNPIDEPMCQYYFGRMILTDLNLYTDTSITGSTLVHKVPLYRLFRPLYDAMNLMGQELWKQMPYQGKLSVTMEQAAALYQSSRKCLAVRFLQEKEGNPPISGKKHLTQQDCETVVRIALIEGNHGESGQSAAQRLERWMAQYMARNQELSSFVGDSRENRELLMLVIYRLALERFAHLQARRVLSDCADLFYTNMMTGDLTEIWKHYFWETTCRFKYKTHHDPIRIGSLKLLGRRLLRIEGALSQLPDVLADSDCAAVILGGKEPSCYQKYTAVLEEAKTRTFYQLASPNIDKQDVDSWSNVCYHNAKCAHQVGFSGVVMPALSVRNCEQSSNTANFGIKCLEYHVPYAATVLRIREWCSEGFAIITPICIDSMTDAARKAVRILSFEVARHGANAILIQCTEKTSTRAHSFIKDFAIELEIPTFIEDQSLSAQKEVDLIQKSSIFGTVTKAKQIITDDPCERS